MNKQGIKVLPVVLQHKEVERPSRRSLHLQAMAFLDVGLSGYGGLNNHRETITMAAVYAVLLNRTLVLPLMLPNPHTKPLPIEVMWDLRRLRRLVPVLVPGAEARTDEQALAAARTVGSSVVTATPWCCDVEAYDILGSSAASDRTPVLNFHAAGGWGFSMPYFAASLGSLVAAVVNCVRPDILRCASAIAVELQRSLRRQGGGMLHAIHLRLGGKVPCPLLECGECGMETRDLGGLQHRNCDCKKRIRGPAFVMTDHEQKSEDVSWLSTPEGTIRPERSWRDARRDAKLRGEVEWQDASATMMDAVDCGLAHGRYARGDGFYVATNQPSDEQVDQFAAGLRSRGLHVFRWRDLTAALANTSSGSDSSSYGDSDEFSGAAPAATATSASPTPALSLSHLDGMCVASLRGSIEASVLEQLLCARVPGRYLAHYVSSWDELVLHLRASRWRNGSVGSAEGRGQLALLESKLRVAFDGGRPPSLLRTALEGRCKRCHEFRPRAADRLDDAER